MSDIPVHVQRSFEQRWAAKLASSGTAPELGGPIWLLTVLAGYRLSRVWDASRCRLRFRCDRRQRFMARSSRE